MLKTSRRAILNGTWQPSQVQGPQAAVLPELLKKCGDAGRLWMVFLTGTIIRSAIIEGAAFFMLVTYMVEQYPVAIAAAIVWIFFVAAQYPTRSKAMHWIEDQLNLLEQQRQFDP